MNELFYTWSKPSGKRHQGWVLHLVSAFCLTIIASGMVLAQGTRGTIRGDVTDQNGAAIAGASVKLINVARNQEVRTATTDANGSYTMAEVDPATYEVVVTAQGFAEGRVTNVTVEPNRNVRLDAVQLGVSGTSAVVEVTAAEELVDKESGTLGTTVEARRVEVFR